MDSLEFPWHPYCRWEHLQIGRPAQQCTGRSLVKVGETYVARAIRQYRTKPPKLGEGVETGWRASLGDEGTVRLSSKGESDRITQRSAVQIRPPQPGTPLPKCSGVRPHWALAPRFALGAQKRL